MKNPAHPFCVDVRSSRTRPELFGWRILRKGGAAKRAEQWRSATSYVSFDEARLDARAKLDELVAAWRRETVVPA